MGLNIPEAFVGHPAQRRGSWLRVKEDLGFKMNFLPNGIWIFSSKGYEIL